MAFANAVITRALVAQHKAVITEGTIVMTGNVLLDQGPNALSADKMTVQLSDGTAQMAGRVKTIIQTGNND